MDAEARAGSHTENDETELDVFWSVARSAARVDTMPGYFGPSALGALRPAAWAFGDSPELADLLIALVLDGTKTATSGALWDYEDEQEPLPEPGLLSILLDGAGHPRALIVTTEVSVVPFDRVDAGLAYAEGEGDRSLETWRREHRRFFTEAAVHDRGFAEDMPVVTQRFQLLWPSTG